MRERGEVEREYARALRKLVARWDNCLFLEMIFVEMVMVIVDVLCYAYAAVYLKCILVKVITLSKKEKGGERQGPKR